ncbi:MULTISPECIES: type II toxin-antitoxin system VapC family toxin [unclassified Cyanobium]|uniref:type II toxin-antitoxin system VapC family toxin n=1 Tax=unclassified Cyanobium TaxID=2627006 RepID=UPI0020CC3E35|nr:MULTISPECIES: type II toxin-antitoxin system VapC family toxin [unclassified Cyanobium]MCP9861468.1 type II toxin-antitoxin system VapC family toxin [Cyanobium sp. Cruz-8H5]MCP9868675.1 type II toxin-antitoxin system VapC family toxin [Cyanobium sp. Cruz-8D1]
MIVVDTNVVAYLLLAGPQTEKAEALLLHDPEWAAPVLWRSELRNVLSGYLRRGQLDHQQVLRLQGQAESLLQGREVPVVSADVFRLVEGSDCSAYDCEFVAAALALQTRLISCDRQLLRAFPAITTPLEQAVP